MPDNNLDNSRVSVVDENAEMSVLGAMLTSKDAISDVQAIIKKSDLFDIYKNGLIFNAIINIYNQGGAVDVVTVKDYLAKNGQLSEIGGDSYLVDLYEKTPAVASAGYYAEIVRDLYLRRLVLFAGQTVANLALGKGEAKEILDKSQSAIMKISDEVVDDGETHITPLLNDVLEVLNSRKNNNPDFVKSGYPALDDVIGGFRPGQVVIIGARPSVGKSTMLLDILRNAAFRQNIPSILFSLEESVEQILIKLVSAELEVHKKNFEHNDINDDVIQKVSAFIGDTDGTPLYIDDLNSNIMDIQSKSRRLKSKLEREGKTLKLICIDYIGLVETLNHRENRQVELSEVSRSLKLLAKDLGVVIIAGAQLRRPPADRANHEPTMSELRESGSIEQDADIVILLHRNKSDESNGFMDNDTVLIVDKNRSGKRGSRIPLYLHGHLGKFKEAPNATMQNTLPPELTAPPIDEPPPEDFF